MTDKTAEQERLRFEGDLDKWMRIIGAGITGYQPEAYAVMDMACEEFVRARALIRELMSTLKDIVAPRQCGCSPVCQCNTADSLSIHLDFIHDIAGEALANAKAAGY